MTTHIAEQPLADPLRVHEALKRMRVLHAQGDYQPALDICLQITRAHPEFADGWANAAVNGARLGRWQNALDYAQTALACGCRRFQVYDVLAYVHGKLEQWDKVHRYGLQALNMRARYFSHAPLVPLTSPGPLPPPPSTKTREHNIIAFSLFGSNSKYCEPAILNVQEQPQVYPHWVCRFYVDDSVPGHVINRLRAGGAQIVPVGAPAAQWPGPMWRLLALDGRQAHRILFRDADSVISPREAHAVDQWLVSGKRFHMMRDAYSHTELMLAGLWGAVAGSLPPLAQLMAHFMSAPLQSRHFADQYFLRQYVWPYARVSLMQHDSVFGFMDAVPFPDGARPQDQDGHNVGYSEGSASFTLPCDRPDGSVATWELYRMGRNSADALIQTNRVCAYPGTVKNGALKAHIPRRYRQWIDQGTAGVRLVSGDTA